MVGLFFSWLVRELLALYTSSAQMALFLSALYSRVAVRPRREGCASLARKPSSPRLLSSPGTRFSVAAILLTSLFVQGAAPTPVRADQSTVIRSGNGSIGSRDTLVHALAYGQTGDITPTA